LEHLQGLHRHTLHLHLCALDLLDIFLLDLLTLPWRRSILDNLEPVLLIFIL